MSKVDFWVSFPTHQILTPTRPPVPKRQCLWRVGNENQKSAFLRNRTLNTQSLSSTLWNWISDFLTSRPQTVLIGSPTSSSSSALHRKSPGLCAQPPPVHTVHLWLHSQTSREPYCWVCRRHCQYKNGGESRKSQGVHREQSTAQLQQKQGDDHLWAGQQF